MSRLSNDEFFTRLGELFESRKGKDHGSVYLSQKRISSEATSASSPSADALDADLHPASPQCILIRASNGKSRENRARKIKLSTLVEPEALDGFYARYAELCKNGMTALKPRDRSKKKAKARSKKKGGATAAAATT